MTDTTTNVTDGSELSTDKEVDLDTMNEEQLRDFAKREREAKERAVAHMKAQNEKRKSIEEALRSKDQGKEQNDSNQAMQTIEELRAEAKRMVQEEHREARIAEYSAGSTDWIKTQSWAEEINNSDTLYGKFSSELKRLAEDNTVHSQADFQRLMRLAAVTVTGKPDALLPESFEGQITTDKLNTPAGYRGSTAPKSAQSLSRLSQEDKVLVQRINANREKRGEKPLTVEQILNS